jgi:hypothetical protein
MTNEQEFLRHEIAKRAYELWEQRGRPVGSGEQDWLAAEKAIRHHLSLDLDLSTLDVAGIRTGTEEPI